MCKTNWKKCSRLLVTGALAVSLAACNLTRKEVAPPPLINGKWAQEGKEFTSTFQNGRFTTQANDTGGIVAEGNYVLIDDNRVQISWYGKVSGQNSTANCVKNGSNRLDCTDLAGRKFSLVRIGTT